MCSGCSGDFEGDGEEQDLGEDEFTGDEPEPCGGVEAAESDCGPGAGSGAIDDYDVLVSAERIVERRTMRANVRIFSPGQAEDAQDAWRNSRRQREQTSEQSAKYYRTRQRQPETHVVNSRTNDKWFFFISLASVGALALAAWLICGRA
jgi:hypothetical protein